MVILPGISKQTKSLLLFSVSAQCTSKAAIVGYTGRTSNDLLYTYFFPASNGHDTFVAPSSEYILLHALVPSTPINGNGISKITALTVVLSDFTSWSKEKIVKK